MDKQYMVEMVDAIMDEGTGPEQIREIGRMAADGSQPTAPDDDNTPVNDEAAARVAEWIYAMSISKARESIMNRQRQPVRHKRMARQATAGQPAASTETESLKKIAQSLATSVEKMADAASKPAPVIFKPNINVSAPITMPEQPPAEVNVNVDVPEQPVNVNVDVPRQEPPVIHNILDVGDREKIVETDSKGDIKRVVDRRIPPKR